MKQGEKLIIYNLFPLLAGKFPEWGKHMERAAEMGFNWLFVNPIQLPGKSGSLYSIRDHARYNPVLVDDQSSESPKEQVTAAIEQAKELGLRVMIDLVVNHCAVDSDLLDKHPEWFSWESQGRVAHPWADENGKKVVWEDLAKFDHRNSRDREGLYKFFKNFVDSQIELGFEGFRCDAAYQVPGDFWSRLIGETRQKHPDVRFFAETLGCPPGQTIKTARAGFDYIFNSSKWWDFRKPWLMEQYVLTRDIVPSIAFPESHDTVRLCDELNGNVAGLKQRYWFAALFSAGVMIPIGFEFGFRKKLHVVKTRPEDWEDTNIDLRSFITEVNRIKSEHPVFREDAPTELIDHGNQQVLVMWKGSAHTTEEALLILNKDIHNRQNIHADKLQEDFQAGTPIEDLSLDYPLDYIPTPFSYDLNPGQVLVLVNQGEEGGEAE